MGRSVITHADQARLRLASAVRQASLHATPGEQVQLERLTAAVRAGEVSVPAAARAVAALRRDQAGREPDEPVQLRVLAAAPERRRPPQRRAQPWTPRPSRAA